MLRRAPKSAFPRQTARRAWRQPAAIRYDPDMRPQARLDPRSVEIVDEDVARILRAKTGAERLDIAFGLYTSAHAMLTSMLKGDHPDWSEKQVQDEVGRRLSHGHSAG